MTYKVEYNIPIPEVARRTAYPFADMKPGGSFAVPCTPEEQQELIERIRSAATYHRKKSGGRYVVRAATENGQLLVRCWRLEKDR